MFCTFSSYVFVWTSGRMKSPLKTKENCFFDREKLSALIFVARRGIGWAV